MIVICFVMLSFLGSCADSAGIVCDSDMFHHVVFKDPVLTLQVLFVIVICFIVLSSRILY